MGVDSGSSIFGWFFFVKKLGVGSNWLLVLVVDGGVGIGLVESKGLRLLGVGRKGVYVWVWCNG